METAKRINSFPEEVVRQKYVKYWHDLLLCKLFGDPRVPLPVEAFVSRPLYSGWLRKCVARLFARRDVSFFYSLQKGVKAAWPELPEAERLKALGDHAKALSSEPTPVHVILQKRITHISSQTFERMSERELFTKFMPSGSSCAQASRREGGALSLASHILNPFEGAESLGKLRALDMNVHHWRSLEFPAYLARAEKSLDYGYQEFLAAPSGDQVPHRLVHDVDAIAIAEPSKFRVITVGDGNLYTAIQPFQGALLKCWKDDPSSTMRDGCLRKRVQGLYDHSPRDDFVWFSSDFKSATDGLAPWGTQAAFAGIPACPFWELAAASLRLGECRYKECIIDGVYHRDYSVNTTNGQMMGHPLSFPFLCVINKACYSLAVESYCDESGCSEEVKRLLRDQVPLINGDDILFRGPRGLRENHNRICALVGLKPSLGKDYCGSEFAMINSQVFRVRKCDGTVVRQGYLNQRFRTGVDVKVGESLARPTELSRDINSMVELCPWGQGMVPECVRRFDLRKVGFAINWFLPVHLGGLGLKANGEYRVTTEQRLLANHFVHDPSLSLYWTKGASLKVAKTFPSLARVRLVPWAGPLVSQVEAEEILIRLAYAMRVSNPSIDPPESGLRRIVRKWRHRPLSPEGLKVWWHARLECTSTLPPIMPLQVFRGSVLL